VDRRRRTGPIMYYVYLIQSISNPDIVYVGYTINVDQRLETHNSGGSIYTAQHRPWTLIMFLAFTDQKKGKNFEAYLKSQSGRAFAKKRLW
jgi:putative endonuclease